MLNLDHTYVIRLVEIHKILSQEYYHEILVYYHMSFIISTSNMLKQMFFFSTDFCDIPVKDILDCFSIHRIYLR